MSVIARNSCLYTKIAAKGALLAMSGTLTLNGSAGANDEYLSFTIPSGYGVIRPMCYSTQGSGFFNYSCDFNVSTRVLRVWFYRINTCVGAKVTCDLTLVPYAWFEM